MLNYSQLTVDFDHCGLSFFWGGKALGHNQSCCLGHLYSVELFSVSNGRVRLERGHNHCHQKGDTGPNGGALASCP